MSEDSMTGKYEANGMYNNCQGPRDQLKTEALCRIADGIDQLNMRLAAMSRLDEAHAAVQQAQLEAIAGYLNRLTGDER